MRAPPQPPQPPPPRRPPPAPPRTRASNRHPHHHHHTFLLSSGVDGGPALNMGSAGQLVELYWFLHAAAATAREADLRIFSPCGSPSAPRVRLAARPRGGRRRLLSDALMPAVVAVFGACSSLSPRWRPMRGPGRRATPRGPGDTPHPPRPPHGGGIQLERDARTGSKDGARRLDREAPCPPSNADPSACETLGGCPAATPPAPGATNLRASAWTWRASRLRLTPFPPAQPPLAPSSLSGRRDASMVPLRSFEISFNTAMRPWVLEWAARRLAPPSPRPLSPPPPPPATLLPHRRLLPRSLHHRRAPPPLPHRSHGPPPPPPRPRSSSPLQVVAPVHSARRVLIAQFHKRRDRPRHRRRGAGGAPLAPRSTPRRCGATTRTGCARASGCKRSPSTTWRASRTRQDKRPPSRRRGSSWRCAPRSRRPQAAGDGGGLHRGCAARAILHTRPAL